MTTSSQAPQTAAAPHAPAGAVGAESAAESQLSLLTMFGRALRSELVKTRSVASTYWTLAIAVVGAIGFGSFFAATMVMAWQDLPGAEQAMMDPVQLSLGGIDVALVVVVVFGVLAITSEYSSGSIRTTLAAIPNRALLLAAKVTVVGITALAIGVVTVLAMFLIGQAILTQIDMSLSLTDTGVFGAVARGALLVALMALFGLALGVLARSSAGAITIVLALVYIPAMFGALLPEWAMENILPFIPGGAITLVVQLSSEVQGEWFQTPLGAISILTGWVVLLLAGAVVLLSRRDA